MSSKEFVLGLSERIGTSEEITRRIIRYIDKCIGNVLESGRNLSLSPIGAFVVERRMERVVIDPTTQKRMLIPPQNLLKLVETMEGEGDVAGIQEVTDELARLSRLPSDAAETIVKSFFGYMQMALRSDDNLDIDGLGHFQITGEDKTVVFTPAQTMNEWVNKPFSQFVPVILNDGVFFPDIEQEQSQEPTREYLPKNISETSQEPISETSQEQAPASSHDVAPAQKAEQKMPVRGDEAVEGGKDLQTTETPVSIAPDEVKTSVVSPQAVRSGKLYKIILSLALVAALLFVIGYVIGHFSNEGDAVAPAEVETQVTQESDGNERESSTVDYDAVNEQLIYGAYKVTAVDTTIIVARTQTIRQLAATYFGGEQMEMYIKALNGGKEMAVVGDTLLIPHLERKR